MGMASAVGRTSLGIFATALSDHHMTLYTALKSINAIAIIIMPLIYSFPLLLADCFVFEFAGGAVIAMTPILTTSFISQTDVPKVC